MKSFTKILFLNLFLLYALTTYAGAQGDLKNILSSIQSFQASFHQTVYSRQGIAKQQYTGVMALSRPNHFYWKTTSPIQQISIANGKQLWVYDPTLKQASVQTLKSGKVMTPAAILSGSDKGILNDFYISQMQGWFILKPKAQAMVNKVSLKFQNNMLQQMQLVDEMGQTTVIHFSNAQVNKPISPTLFQIHIPKGADITHLG